MSKFFYTDGRETKGIDPWHSDGEMWKYNSNPPAGEMDELYARVAAVYRAVNFTADTLSNMPFAITSEAGGKEIDISDEYHNKVGFLPYPRQLLRLMTQSFLVTNRAYAFKETQGRTIKNLRYIAPATVAPKVDDGGILGFTRTIGTTKTFYPIKNGVCNIVYAFQLNWKNELLPDDNSPFKAMMNAAGIGLYADKYIKDFFERGGIKPTILTFDGPLDQTSMERVESVWTKVIRGYYRFLGKVFNGKFTPVTIGEGIESLKDEKVYDNALRNIAIAVGMPLDALLQNASNYATAQVHKSTWFSDTLVPMAQALAEPINEQVFQPLGYRFEFRPEVADPDMEEERRRIDAAQVLHAILVQGRRMDADKVALETFGIDLPQWFTWEVEEEPKLEETTDTEQEEPKYTPMGGGSGVNDDEDKGVTITALREMTNWQELAFRKLKRGQSLKFDWTPKDIPLQQAAAIKAKLDMAVTEDDIKAAFDVAPVKQDDEIIILADALNKAASAVIMTQGEKNGIE